MRAILRSGFLALAIIALAVPANAGRLEDSEAAFQRGDYAADLKFRRPFLRPLAEQGDAAAQYSLGLIYHMGEGVPQNYVEAVKWFRMAAEQGYAKAQNNLGFMYDIGRGLPQDDAEAAKWYRMAAEQGLAEAQTNLGFMYIEGKGVPQDYVSAYLWFNLAVTQNIEGAQKRRDIAASQMTPDQLAEAQRIAREWMAEHRQ